ncbi:alginate O-acetyltransferase [Rhodoblastus acidophilus]|uniref:Alginate O-acetyltransferase n=1 Tax=Candidatus Rhodoblastus alkanivorans TaxID=2954117 RepID=A0ABS9Z733_9HYPH|nr:alginate O-acetyltransferase [Candidatus Rhodoblastus alkanivorans]MCI4679214.1 alginate O-acetyltransferase [Candidatus Rhodoblastus alkanivorans]MCI4682462.1 alginate O-acetyltransferase [Candidatus Rhodoblastus alkanivorans]MDI4639768.1 alginate O-acetyltransferase [Rhodoblastus acidophilus]
MRLTIDRARAAKLYGLLLLGFCAVATSLGGLLTFAGNPDPLANEKRRLARLEFPTSLAQWQKFPKNFDAFFSDNFGFRTALIRLDSKVSLAFLGRLPSERVVTGKKDWLFFAGEHSIELYQNALPLSASDLAVMRERIAGRRDRLAAKGIGYEFVIAPDKHTIYPEYMLDRFLRRSRPSQYSQTMEMAKEAKLPVVDLRPVLLAAKPHGLVYLRDDTHWNDIGAALAMGPILAGMAPKFQFPPPSVTGKDFEMKSLPTGDLAEMALINRRETAPVRKESSLPCKFEVTEKDWDSAGRKLHTRTHCPGKKGKLLFIHDSFGDALVPLLAARFGDMYALWIRPTDQQFDILVAQEKPDFVLEERAERNLSSEP